MPALRMLIFLSVVKGFLSYFLVRVIVGTSLHRREVLFTQLNFQHLHEICALEVIQMIVRNRPKIPSFKCSISKVKPKSNEMPTPQHTYPPGCRRRSNTNNWRKSHWTHTPRASIRSSLVTSGLVESLGNTAYWSVFFFMSQQNRKMPEGVHPTQVPGTHARKKAPPCRPTRRLAPDPAPATFSGGTYRNTNITQPITFHKRTK